VKGDEMSQSLHSSQSLVAEEARRASWAAASSSSHYSSGIAIGVPADEHEHSSVGIPIPSVPPVEEDSVPSAPPIPLDFDYGNSDYPAAIITRVGESADRTSSDDFSQELATLTGEEERRRRRHLFCCTSSKRKRVCCVAGLVLVVLLAAVAGGLAIAFAGKTDERTATSTDRDRDMGGGGGGSFYQWYTKYNEACDDVPPPNCYHSCKKQSDWGKCEKDWMQGYCRDSCGTCDPPGLP
jgi:hypothetical protein